MPKLDPGEWLDEPSLAPCSSFKEDTRTEEEKVIDRLSGTRRFYVDFASWSVEAKDEHEATLIAEQKLRNGERPEICEVAVE